MTRLLVGLLTMLTAPVALSAQAPDDVLAAAQSLRRQVAELQRAERDLMPPGGASVLEPADDDALERRTHLRAEVMRNLEVLLAAGPAGRTEIQRLAVEFPSADLVRRAEIRAAFVADEPDEVLALADRMRISVPRDTQLLRWRAEAYEALGRQAEALQARQARWELAPEDGEAWRALVRAHERAGSLERLRESVARLRLLHPASTVVREQEMEILHRLGRYDEAARVAPGTDGP